MNMEKQSKKLSILRNGKTEKFFEHSKFQQKIAEQPLGLLNLPTGSIVANDPLCLFETDPFDKTVTPGSYQTFLYIHHFETDRRVAFAEIRFSENIPIRFDLALTNNQHLEELDEDEFYGYGVDSGTGCFVDKLTLDEYVKLTDLTEDGMLPDLEKELDLRYIHTYSFANYTLSGSPHNLILFSSGYGDGAYASYWGYDTNNELCCLITDFETVDDED